MKMFIEDCEEKKTLERIKLQESLFRSVFPLMILEKMLKDSPNFSEALRNCGLSKFTRAGQQVYEVKFYFII